MNDNRTPKPKSRVGFRMLLACIMGYGLGVTQTAGLIHTGQDNAVLLTGLLGLFITLIAFLIDWRTSR